MVNSQIDRGNYPLVLGVDLGGTQIRTAVLCGSELLSKVQLPTGRDTGPDRIIPRIDYSIGQALDKAEVKLDMIAGIGIGVPGPVNSEDGIIFDLPNLVGWKTIQMQRIFAKHYPIRIIIENDGNAAALAEHLFGAGRGCKNMVYLTLGTGIGGGVIVNNQLLRGASGTAAEIGHMTIDWHGEKCVCGNFGCLESIASGASIARRAVRAIESGYGDELLPWATLVSGDGDPANSGKEYSIDARAVALAAAGGLPLAVAIIQDAATALGIGLTNIIHLFNPELIVLGGGLIRMGPLLMEPVLQVMRERTMEVPRESVRIAAAQLGPDTGVIGAGALILYANYNQAAISPPVSL